MKLIDLLVQELPKRGGWPKKAYQCAQDDSGKVCFYTEGLIHRDRMISSWSIPRTSPAEYLSEYSAYHHSKVVDASTAITTREQYEAALQQPAWNGEGLPPIGCEFEYGTHKTKAKCLGLGVDMVFACKGSMTENGYDEFLISIYDSSFHVLRTEAERKRDNSETALRTCLAGTGAGITPLAAKGIYDAIAAGKIPGVKLDD